jgi:hypothetical protein
VVTGFKLQQAASGPIELVQVCRNPVFIIGSPRSGTSALAWALHHHPAFWTSKETEFLQPLVGSQQARQAFDVGVSRGDGWLPHHDVGRDEFFAYVGLGVNALLTSRAEGRRWVDQTPSYTLFADELARLFPGALFLHIVRDGRSVVNSMIHFGESVGRQLRDKNALPEWASGFRPACETWVAFCRAALRFGAEQPERCLLVRNEDLSAGPAVEFRSVLAFLGEKEQPGPANFFATSRINSSFVSMKWGDASGRTSVSQDAQSALSGSRTALTWNLKEQEVFREVAGSLLAELGYERRSRPREVGR